MYRYMLNIGLHESSIIGNGGRIKASHAAQTVTHATLSMFNFTAEKWRQAVHNSDTEPTLVCEIRTETPDFGRVRMLAEVLCSRLKQEAVAVARLDDNGNVKHGALCGPMAERWGRFNPEYFIMLNGQRAA